MNKTGVIAAAMALAAWATPAQAIEKLCDPAAEDCRATLINLIRNERVGSAPYSNYIDEAIYFTDLPSVVASFKTCSSRDR